MYLAHTAHISYFYVIDVSLFVCNDEIYGFVMVPLENEDTIMEDMQRLTNTKVEILGKFAYIYIYVCVY